VLCVTTLLVGSYGCVAPGPTEAPGPTGMPASLPVAEGTPDPTAPRGERLADFGWYEVDRVHDTEGNETRTLYAGSLDGRLLATVPLGTLDGAVQEGRANSFEWTDPQVAGIFADSVLVWGRQGGRAAVEAVRIDDGSIEPLITDTDDTVHVVTADAALRRIFFVSVDETTQLPSGLWVHEIGRARPLRLAYDFPDRAVDRQFQYHLAADRDGTLLAVQAGLNGTVTLIRVGIDGAREVGPGGEMLGFAGESLIALGGSSDATLGRKVYAYPPAGAGLVVADGVDGAQLVEGAEGPRIAIMRSDPNDPRRYEISAVDFRTGVSQLVYLHTGAEIGPSLASFVRNPLGAELPFDSALLADSFFPFIERGGRKIPPSSDSPMLLDLDTRETTRLGPFAEPDR
jgi:hypothetical protein